MNLAADDDRAHAASITIMRGYRPGLIGTIVTLHAETYSRWVGFGRAFECRVATELADFVARPDHPRSALWHATLSDRIVGSIAIDGEDLGAGTAHLRWFIVDPTVRGAGLGRQLLRHALDFVDRAAFDETRLWTLQGLDAARSLYQRTGFTLETEYQGDQWGRAIAEQTYVRRRSVAD